MLIVFDEILFILRNPHFSRLHLTIILRYSQRTSLENLVGFNQRHIMPNQ